VPIAETVAGDKSVNITETSRLKNATLVEASNGSQNVVFWDLPVLPNVVPLSTDQIIDVPNNKRLDQISTDKYGTPHYWDLIAQANFFSLIPGDPRPGTKIRIPSLTRIVTTLRP